jgi:hypothetical protein
MLCLVGTQWLKLQEEKTYMRRVDVSGDWFREEIAAALLARKVVIPVMVDGATPLPLEALNTLPDIAAFATLTALELRADEDGWAADLAKLVRLLRDEHGFPRVPVAPGDGDRARAALEQLIDLTSETEVRRAVVRYASVLTATNGHITAMRVYKDCHELLSGVQHTYDSLVRDGRSFPHRSVAREAVGGHVGGLERHVDAAARIAGDLADRDALLHERLQDVITPLAAALDDLRKAVAEVDQQPFKSAEARLRDVLSQQPSYFNRDLNTTARHLQLGQLVEVVTEARNAVASAELPPETVGQFQRGLDDLCSLQRELDTGVREHDAWQQADDTLRLLHTTTPARVLGELENTLPILRARLGRAAQLATLAGAGGSRLGSDGLSSQERSRVELGAAYESGNRRRVAEALQALRVAVGRCLDDADHRLLGLCGRIGKLENPLRTLAELAR